jgi:hypothetical protein
MGKAKRGICPYCGQNRKLTADHVIPKCLFIPPLPPNMRTVKACHQCNMRKKSGDDSLLRDFLCMDAWGTTHPMARKLFEGAAMRSIGYNNSELLRFALECEAEPRSPGTYGCLFARSPSEHFAGLRAAAGVAACPRRRVWGQSLVSRDGAAPLSHHRCGGPETSCGRSEATPARGRPGMCPTAGARASRCDLGRIMRPWGRYHRRARQSRAQVPDGAALGFAA